MAVHARAAGVGDAPDVEQHRAAAGRRLRGGVGGRGSRRDTGTAAVREGGCGTHAAERSGGEAQPGAQHARARDPQESAGSTTGRHPTYSRFRRRRRQTKPLFRRPTELADGLALKEQRYGLGRVIRRVPGRFAPWAADTPPERFPRFRPVVPGRGTRLAWFEGRQYRHDTGSGWCVPVPLIG